MLYINTKTMTGIDPDVFRSATPFPWVNPEGFLTMDGFNALVTDLPNLSQFKASFNIERKHGQYAHDRYVLEYKDGIEIPQPWQQFIDLLRSNEYRYFIAQLLGHKHFRFRFHWHWAPAGCSVSPHCDSKGKLGSHIFYLNTPLDWNPKWGGETVILDDNGRFSPNSHPSFEDFDLFLPAKTMNNRSLIFGRRGNSWHGVRPITCPEGKMRKVFIVVFENYRPYRVLIKKIRRFVRGKPLVTDKERAMY